jgi:hypothetical protein
MPITHTNRKGKTYHLHQRTTKTGKASYHFSMKQEGELAEAIPDGFEIYETPNGQVFLRRIQREIITGDEVDVVKHEVGRHRRLKYHQVEAKGNAITLFEPNQDVEGLSALMREVSGRKDRSSEELLSRFVTVSPLIRFVLLDEDRRTFIAERYHFSGPVNEWIPCGDSGTLGQVVHTALERLGRNGFPPSY